MELLDEASVSTHYTPSFPAKDWLSGGTGSTLSSAI
jgi:hypothetical protein